jgi:hypothetical protein
VTSWVVFRCGPSGKNEVDDNMGIPHCRSSSVRAAHHGARAISGGTGAER